MPEAREFRDRVAAAKAAPATVQTLVKTKRAAAIAVWVCVPVILAFFATTALTSSVQGIENIACVPNDGHGCFHVDTPPLNAFADVASFLLGAPALIGGIALWTLISGWRAEVRKFRAQSPDT